MSELELLRAARARIAKRGAWTRHVIAKNPDGYATVPGAEDAVKWCAIGAVTAETTAKGRVRMKAVKKLDNTAYELFGKSLTNVNDTMRKKDVLLVFEVAIERLEAK